MSVTTFVRAVGKSGELLQTYASDTDLLTRLAGEVAAHPGKPARVPFRWSSCSGNLENPKGVKKSLRWIEGFLRGDNRLEDHVLPPRSAPPLHRAAARGKRPDVAEALQRVKNVNRRDRGDLTALMWAVRNNHHDVARSLLASGADVDAGASISYEELMEAEPSPVRASEYVGFVEADLEGFLAICEYAIQEGAWLRFEEA